MAGGVSEPLAERISTSAPVVGLDTQVKRKVKRKASKYQREFGKQLKKLKRKHPRTKVQNLMKRAHTATKKLMKR
jgi:hypothetical protein|tara:strand:+ start:185 stop:409 length:225 start_codon:yes stop_codon:yes gene_type:complete